MCFSWIFFVRIFPIRPRINAESRRSIHSRFCHTSSAAGPEKEIYLRRVSILLEMVARARRQAAGSGEDAGERGTIGVYWRRVEHE